MLKLNAHSVRIHCCVFQSTNAEFVNWLYRGRRSVFWPGKYIRISGFEEGERGRETCMAIDLRIPDKLPNTEEFNKHVLLLFDVLHSKLKDRAVIIKKSAYNLISCIITPYLVKKAKTQNATHSWWNTFSCVGDFPTTSRHLSFRWSS